MKFSQTLYKYCNKRIFCGLTKPHRDPVKKEYNYFIIIPSYAEKFYLEDTLDSIDQQEKKILKKTLVIIVINNSENGSRAIKKNNHQTYQKIINLNYNFEFVVIDCFSNTYALPEKTAGVGLARKIGMDYCIEFSHMYSLFFSIDADTLIDKNYLTIIIQEYQKKQFGAAVINFKHQTSKNTIIEEG